jgi:hypothetical protein
MKVENNKKRKNSRKRKEKVCIGKIERLLKEKRGKTWEIYIDKR